MVHLKEKLTVFRSDQTTAVPMEHQMVKEMGLYWGLPMVEQWVQQRVHMKEKLRGASMDQVKEEPMALRTDSRSVLS